MNTAVEYQQSDTVSSGSSNFKSLLVYQLPRHAAKLRLRKPRVLLAFVQILLTCVFHFKSLVIVMPIYFFSLHYRGAFPLWYR